MALYGRGSEKPEMSSIFLSSLAASSGTRCSGWHSCKMVKAPSAWVPAGLRGAETPGDAQGPANEWKTTDLSGCICYCGVAWPTLAHAASSSRTTSRGHLLLRGDQVKEHLALSVSTGVRQEAGGRVRTAVWFAGPQRPLRRPD